MVVPKFEIVYSTPTTNELLDTDEPALDVTTFPFVLGFNALIELVPFPTKNVFFVNDVTPTPPLDNGSVPVTLDVKFTYL